MEVNLYIGLRNIDGYFSGTVAVSYELSGVLIRKGFGLQDFVLPWHHLIKYFIDDLIELLLRKVGVGNPALCRSFSNQSVGRGVDQVDKQSSFCVLADRSVISGPGRKTATPVRAMHRI